MENVELGEKEIRRTASAIADMRKALDNMESVIENPAADSEEWLYLEGKLFEITQTFETLGLEIMKREEEREEELCKL